MKKKSGARWTICPVRWSFDQPYSDGTLGNVLNTTYFYRTDTNKRWERFGYTPQAAQSLVDYLNSRNADQLTGGM